MSVLNTRYNVFTVYLYRHSKMMSVIVILFLKLCLAQEALFIPQDNDFSRTTKLQYDWKNNFNNNLIIPDAYVFNY